MENDIVDDEFQEHFDEWISPLNIVISDITNHT